MLQPWYDEAIVIHRAPHGENLLRLQALTAEHGLVSAWVSQNQQRRERALWSPANHVALSWRPGSQPQSLGYFSGDMKTSLAARLLMQYRLSMATQALLVLVHSTVTEREALPDLFLLLKAWLMALPTDAAPLSADAMVACGVLYLQLERRILEVIGYGLDLGRCALSGSEGPLAYVSPKTGRAASLKAASAYASQLFPLPACLVDASAPADREAIVQGLRITGHFLQRFFQEHRPHFSGLSLRDPWVQSW